jgi:3-methyladenine DNA glycosylase AlkC
MAEPLKNQYGPEIPERIAGMIQAMYPAFDMAAFLADVLSGYEALELMPRGKHIAHALRRHLPGDYPEAVAILLASMRAAKPYQDGQGLASFLYMPHAFFVAEYGLEHFAVSMQAQYEITQRFTAEFSIRPFLQRYPDLTLAQLRIWTKDSSEHVRRLVSEGTRPRLPWAPRLPAFQKNPTPTLALLERLKDDPSLYVRRSVANHLNDIGKDHPQRLLEVAQRWLKGAGPERQWLIRHALRSLVKQGHPAALALMGFGQDITVEIHGAQITPAQAPLGSHVTLTCEVHNPTELAQQVLVDFRVHYVKANGRTSPKVFKLKTLDLPPRGRVPLQKKVSLAPMTTRRLYPGTHTIDLLINGQPYPLGSFVLMDAVAADH